MNTETETKYKRYAAAFKKSAVEHWLPYGQRRVECLLPDDPPEQCRTLGIHYVVVSGVAVKQTYGSLGKWLGKYNASLVDQYTFPSQSRLATDPPDLYIVRLN